MNIPNDVSERMCSIEKMCMEVYKTLGSGLTDDQYTHAVKSNLKNSILGEVMPIEYEGINIGYSEEKNYILSDFPCILRVCSGDGIDLWKMVRYMGYKECNYGVVITFNRWGVVFRYIVNDNGTVYMYDLKTGAETRMVDYKEKPVGRPCGARTLVGATVEFTSEM